MANFAVGRPRSSERLTALVCPTAEQLIFKTEAFVVGVSRHLVELEQQCSLQVLVDGTESAF